MGVASSEFSLPLVLGKNGNGDWRGHGERDEVVQDWRSSNRENKFFREDDGEERKDGCHGCAPQSVPGSPTGEYYRRLADLGGIRIQRGSVVLAEA